MGTVYLARHPRLPRKVALKLLNREVSADQEVRRRFEREANVIARLDHPSIVGIHDRGVQDGHLWIAVQYVPGTDAARLDPRAVSVERAVRIISETAAALDYAHSHGILHRDVKPANILLWAAATGRDERAVLTDFGIAALADSNTQLTATGMFSATLAFASPEQLSGERLDHRGDQYSLACTCYALLTGHGPFPATNPGQVVAGHLNKPLPHLHPQRPDVPPALDEVLARAAAKSPAARYPDCSTFAAAARAALTTRSSTPLSRPPATTPNPNATRPGADTPTPDAAEPHPGTATSHPTRFGPGTAHSGTANGHLPATPPGAAATAHPGSANGRPAAAPGAAANPGTAGGYPAAGSHPRAAAGPGIAAHRGAGTSAPDAAAHRHTAAPGPGWAADPGAAVGFPAPGTPAAAAMSRGAAADGPGVAAERGAAGIGPGAAVRPGSGEASPRGGGGAGGGAAAWSGSAAGRSGSEAIRASGAVPAPGTRPFASDTGAAAGSWAGGGKPSAATPRARQDEVAGSRASGRSGHAAGRAASGRRGPEGSGAGRRSTAAVTAAGLALMCSFLALLCVVRLAAQIGGLRYIPDAFRDVRYPGYPYLAVGLGFAGVVAALLAGGALLLPLSRRIGRRWIVLGSLGFMAGAAGSQLYVHYVGRNIHALTMYYPLQEPVAVAASGIGFLLALGALIRALAIRR
ncbi:protein kinase [Nocardia otitidiscaviarum]|nr:protein kinase [Nocardia otitidiscaviarum]